jgi:hypothetical protein
MRNNKENYVGYYRFDEMYDVLSVGLNDLVHFYQHEKSSELPCRLSKPCPDGQPPPPLSLSTGHTNLLHKAIAAGLFWE